MRHSRTYITSLEKIPRSAKSELYYEQDLYQAIAEHENRILSHLQIML